MGYCSSLIFTNIEQKIKCLQAKKMYCRLNDSSTDYGICIEEKEVDKLQS